MMEVEQQTGQLNAAHILKALLEELGAVSDYRTLRDTLPRRLARLLRCRCVILYQRNGESLQFISGSFDDNPGWSSALLAVTHINPISVRSDTPEARAWQQRKALTWPHHLPSCVAAPLLYRARSIGVLVALRGEQSPASPAAPSQAEPQGPASPQPYLAYWSQDDTQVVEAIAGVVAMLLENARLLERDRDRIQELSLLNSISRQFHASLQNAERVRDHIVQRAREISSADLCDCILPGTGQHNSAWLSPALQALLLPRLGEQAAPIIIERPGDATSVEYLALLDTSLKTFFAIPLWSGRSEDQAFPGPSKAPRLLGALVGAYTRPWKLRREEIVLLTMLANQASSVVENIALMAEVMEARNEARKLLRQVLDDQHQQELILESIPSGLLAIDLHGRITTCNRAAAAMLDRHAFEVVGQPVQKILALHSFQQVIQSEILQRETLTITIAEGQERIVQVMLLPFRSDQGELVGALATLTDMTATHRLEEEKRRLDRLASLGEMAANVAHEVRNPLASIKTSIQMLIDDLVHEPVGQLNRGNGIGCVSEGTQESISIVFKEIERLDAIVRDLLHFSRPGQLHRARYSLAGIIDRVLHMLKQQCEETGIVVHRIYHDTPPISVDRAQIEQVLLNLTLNALQAMPDGGTLTVSLQPAQAPAASPAQITPGRIWIELSISDTGIGIASEQIDRIFQPFYTTKAHGIGLGLPISRRLVEDHQGQLLAESELGFGSTFTIRLPQDEHGITWQGNPYGEDGQE